MYHHWMDTDGEVVDLDPETRRAEVSCLLCGVVTPEWQSGSPYFVSVSHGPLPLLCPGNKVENPHLFTATGPEDSVLECYHCHGTVDWGFMLDDVVWECGEPHREW
jgi:hypothetical protein